MDGEEVRKYLCLGSVQAVYKYEKGIGYPPADTMFALMELYEADLRDVIGNHESEQCASPLALDWPELISADITGKRQVNRLKSYYKLYMENARKAAG